MNLFSGIFNKVQSDQGQEKTIKKTDSIIGIPLDNGTVNVSVLPTEPNIPPLQGNYAKAVFLWAFSKPSQIWVDNNQATVR